MFQAEVSRYMLVVNNITYCQIIYINIKNVTCLSETPRFKFKIKVYYGNATNCPRVLINLKGGSFHESLSRNLQKVDKKTRELIKETDVKSKRNSISFNIAKLVKLSNSDSKLMDHSDLQ